MSTKLIVFYFTLCIAYIGSAAEETEIKCNGPNEHYECGSACPTTCENKGRRCNIINKTCNKGCYCDEGYARKNETSECIPYNECEMKVTCSRKHEHYECGSACQTRCDNLDEQCNIRNIMCNHKCYCDYGYARISDDDGDCVPTGNCPKTCTKPNERLGCGPCERECSDLTKTCEIFTFACQEGCYCTDGHARDHNGDCIPVDQCPCSKSYEIID